MIWRVRLSCRPSRRTRTRSSSLARQRWTSSWRWRPRSGSNSTTRRFRHLIRHLFRGPKPEKVSFFADQFVKKVEASLGERIEVSGPTPCSIEQIKDHDRFQIWYFTKNVTQVVAEIRRLQEGINWPKDVVQVLDVDAFSIS